MKKTLPIVNKSRSCGGCVACCTVIAVPVLQKPSYVSCPHLVPGGCGIYSSRPDNCRTWECAWLQGGFGDNDRPDKTGVVFYVTTKIPNTIVACEITAGASMSGRAAQIIDLELSAGKNVIVAWKDERRWLEPQMITRV